MQTSRAPPLAWAGRGFVFDRFRDVRAGRLSGRWPYNDAIINTANDNNLLFMKAGYNGNQTQATKYCVGSSVFRAGLSNNFSS